MFDPLKNVHTNSEKNWPSKSVVADVDQFVVIIIHYSYVFCIQFKKFISRLFLIKW
jgi:hypothetical protein